MLTVEKINVFYGNVQALWDVSLKVEKGEVVALIGSNGAGKTTTLKTVSGLLRPRSGSISFLGEKVDNFDPRHIVELGLVQVPEGRHLFPYMTVLENLKMGAYPSYARKRRNETLEWVFTLFPILKERKGQLAGTLSGGEQQMLAIARGLMARPKLLMLDEPSLGLAPVYTLKIFDLIRKINQEGVTILLVEQNVRQALEISDRGYVLETGRITQNTLPTILLAMACLQIESTARQIPGDIR
ncbi:TPA: ABC transporter ATP-binding protein, partial [Candidatus Bathyarchaeota archaeon]|nr:ABC transporter ATP-binding protein [Candidatus Bathyarchaeota archaeon]